jgi:hypothetical protein
MGLRKGAMQRLSLIWPPLVRLVDEGSFGRSLRK